MERKPKRHNSTVCFQSQNGEQIGQIQTFIEVTDTSGDINYYIVSNLYTAEVTSDLIAVKAADIIEKSICMAVEDKLYISKVIDPFERD